MGYGKILDRQTDIAVVVPVYNAGKKLEACIKSILNQNYENLVCILVDDGSTDGSSKICDRFALKDCRIHVIHQKNKGSVESRKIGVLCEKAQKSKYITFVDADDKLSSDALKKMTNLPQTSLELSESLEQLRALQNGMKIKTSVVDFTPVGIDTVDDLEKFRKIVAAQL